MWLVRRLVAGGRSLVSARMVSLRRSHRLGEGVFVAAFALTGLLSGESMGGGVWFYLCRFHCYTLWHLFRRLCLYVLGPSSCFGGWSVCSAHLSTYPPVCLSTDLLDLRERGWTCCWSLCDRTLTHATERAHDFTSWRQRTGTTMRNGDQIRTTRR